MFSEDVTLIGETFDADEYGQQVPVESETAVRARLVEVGRSEAYQAAVAGLKPEQAFDVHTFEYSGERRLRHAGVEWVVLRTYRHTWRGLDLTELTCERRVGHG